MLIIASITLNNIDNILHIEYIYCFYLDSLWSRQIDYNCPQDLRTIGCSMKGVILRSDKINISNRNKYITINSLLCPLHNQTWNFKSPPIVSLSQWIGCIVAAVCYLLTRGCIFLHSPLSGVLWTASEMLSLRRCKDAVNFFVSD